MVVSNAQSKRSNGPSSLDLSYEYLNIFSARGHLGVADEDIRLHVRFPVELKQEVWKAQKNPSHEWYVRDDVWPNHVCTCEDVCGAGGCLARSPTSSIKIASHNQGGTWQNSCTKRESLLQDAWQRKQEVYLKQELANLDGGPIVSTLGRTSSDCSNYTTGILQQAKYELLERSVSDCGKAKKDALGTPNGLTRTHTRGLTDDDFDELKGCLDLGFRFDQSSILDLCDTIPALEVVSAVNQNFQESLMASPTQSSVPSPSPSWRVTNPGDGPEEVREKLRHWAQAVACSARLCS